MGRVLIVDDSEDMLEMLAQFAALAGCEPVRARNVLEAEAALAGGRPFDLVILDVHMPGFTGLDLMHARCNQFRGPPLPPPPIVVFTGDDRCREAALEFGAVGFVPKTRPEAVIELMGRHCGGASR